MCDEALERMMIYNWKNDRVGKIILGLLLRFSILKSFNILAIFKV